MELNIFANKEETLKKKEEVKGLIRKLKGNENAEDVERLQKEFQKTVDGVNPMIIALAEQDLMKEGYSFSDLRNACDVHLQLFMGVLENTQIKVPEGHPIARFQGEHKGILKLFEALRDTVRAATAKGSKEAAAPELEKIAKIIRLLMDSENHNVRQENTLFPILEKHGVTAPPAIMWEEHTEMKEMKKSFLREFNRTDEIEFAVWMDRLEVMARVLTEKFFAHSQKENHILYDAALQVITEDEWKDIAEECENLGYFSMELK